MSAAYMKGMARHNSSGDRQRYLEGEKQVQVEGRQHYLEEKTPGRHLGRDLINVPLHRSDDWGVYMDEVRALAGNDQDYAGKHAVTYQEFVVSPDPKDNISLNDLRELSHAWATMWFGDEERQGRLGAYNIAIVYHDDNSERLERGEDGILHAHVHVNNTELQSGRRLHLDNTDNHALTTTLQELCRDRGLSYFTLDEENVWDQKQLIRQRGRSRRIEREVIERGDFSWKEDLRCYIEIGMRTTRDFDEFVQMLTSMGVNVVDKGDDVIYQHPSDPTGAKRYRCYGTTLGAQYSKETIRMWHARARIGAQERAPKSYPQRVRAQLADVISGRASHVIAAGPVSLSQIVSMLRVHDRYGIMSYPDFDRQIVYINKRLSTLKPGAIRDALAKDLSLVTQARDTAHACDLFNGIVSTPHKNKSTKKPSSSKHVSGGASGKSNASSSGRVITKHQVATPSQSQSKTNFPKTGRGR